MTRLLRTVITDDDEDLRFLLRFVMNRDPRFEVVGECADGRQALDAVAQLAPDLLLLDLDMPVLDGPGVLVELGGATPPVVVVLTGVTPSLVEERVLALGAAGLVPKSTPAEELLDTVAATVAAAAGWSADDA